MSKSEEKFKWWYALILLGAVCAISLASSILISVFYLTTDYIRGDYIEVLCSSKKKSCNLISPTRDTIYFNWYE